jgi:hypothetical protein
MKNLLILWTVLFFSVSSHAQQFYDNPIPYSTNTSELTIWNGSDYVPIFIKGMNLGISKPGTFPGELVASRDDYARWFSEIKQAGFNVIRLYTLHYPRFYEVLDSFNLANPQSPLLFLQGVWLEEEVPEYNHDLHFITEYFRNEIEENIDCVHGNRDIPHRFGKAYGLFSADVAKWCMGFIIGREVHPIEIITTDENNSEINSYYGSHFSIEDASPSEAWFTEMMDYTVAYQDLNYNTQRPVSVSSWPTLDPLNHPEEAFTDEDVTQIDLSKVSKVNAPAGFFISYHAYPYYPDFISVQSSYLQYFDDYGPNSYLGYLTELKEHYQNIPVIIAEYGVPSSWVIAHYASSGMNHGGFDEWNMGNTNIRMLNTQRNAGCGGGIQFAWIDEWFKRTWITDPVDYNPESRVLWHNIASAEQNYGLKAFEKESQLELITNFDDASDILYIKADANYTFFEFEIGLKNPLDIPDELWIAIDTYDENLGESVIPSGETIPAFRSEFVLHITNYNAILYVTEAYDIYGIWHGISEPEQLFQSVPSDGAPWNVVRIKNNYSHSDVQYIGSMQLNYDFQPLSSKDAVIVSDESIKIRIPWSYLNFVAPDQMKVIHDDRNTPETEDIVSDGIALSVFYNENWHETDQRIVWDTWNSFDVSNLQERFKTSYWVMKDRLPEFNTPAIAVRDSFLFSETAFPVFVDAQDGLLANDFDLDGNYLVSLLIQNPKNGSVILNNDGSFTYNPNPGFIGIDSLAYTIYDGNSLSKENFAIFNVENNTNVEETLISDNVNKLNVFPNPASSFINVSAASEINTLSIFDFNGSIVAESTISGRTYNLDIKHLKPGVYMLIANINGRISAAKFVKI